MKATYSQEVSVEKIEFTKSDKDRLKSGEVAFGAGCRMSGTGDDATFFTERKIGTHGVIVNEGDYIVTSSDGTQKVLTADESKVSLSNFKKKEDVPVTDPTKVVVQTTDGTQKILDEDKSADLLKDKKSK